MFKLKSIYDFIVLLFSRFKEHGLKGELLSVGCSLNILQAIAIPVISLAACQWMTHVLRSTLTGKRTRRRHHQR